MRLLMKLAKDKQGAGMFHLVETMLKKTKVLCSISDTVMVEQCFAFLETNRQIYLLYVFIYIFLMQLWYFFYFSNYLSILISFDTFFKREFTIVDILFNTANVYQIPLHFFETQILYPFLNLITSANHEKGEEFQLRYCFSIVESFINF